VSSIERRGFSVTLSIVLDVEAEIVEDPSPDRLYPVDVERALFRGHDIAPYMYVSHIMEIQRQITEQLNKEQ